jgi:hypothetical protein
MLISVVYDCIYFENSTSLALFKSFPPPIQAKCTKVMRVYDHFQVNFIYLCIFNRMLQHPNPFQFIIHLSPYRLMMLSLSYCKSVLK